MLIKSKLYLNVKENQIILSFQVMGVPRSKIMSWRTFAINSFFSVNFLVKSAYGTKTGLLCSKTPGSNYT